MNDLVGDQAIDTEEHKITVAKGSVEDKNDDLELEPVNYEQEEMDCEEAFEIMEESVPDFLHWSQRVRWTLDQGIALLLGKDPYEVYWKRIRHYVNYYYATPLCRDYSKLRTIVLQAREMNELTNEIAPMAFLEWAEKKCQAIPEVLKKQVEKIKVRTQIKSGIAGFDEFDLDLIKKSLASVEFLKAKTIQIDVLQKERAILQKRVTALEALQWKGFDKADPTYSQELDIAVRAYLHISKNWQPGKSIKKQVLSWLNAEYPKDAKGGSELSQLKRERIARVCNWQQQGGAPRTPKKT